MERYIKFTVSNGYCGCTNEHFEVFEDDMTNEDLDNYGRELARDNAETYAHAATGWDEDFESEDEEEEYYDNAECTWVELSKEDFEEENR